MGMGGVYMFLGAALLGGKWNNGMTVLQASRLHINYYKSHLLKQFKLNNVISSIP